MSYTRPHGFSLKKNLLIRQMSYVIAIPSYKRAQTLRLKTLALLQRYSIPSDLIHIFVADAEEETIYKNTLDVSSYHKIIVGVPKLGPQRNFMSQYFPKNQRIVYMDDDIKDLIQYTDDDTVKRHEKPLEDLHTLIQRGFTFCTEYNCRLWGIYPVANGFFMNDKVTITLRYIVGCFYGTINPGSEEKDLLLELEGDKEDFERTLRYYVKDGSVVRINSVAPKTAYYKEPGGLQEFRTDKTILDGATWIVQKFPALASLNLKKKSGHAEIKLKDRRF